MGSVHQNLGEWAEARRLYDQSLQLERELGDKQGIAFTLAQMGLFEQSVGNLTAALDATQQAESLMIELGNPDNITKIRQQREAIERMITATNTAT